MSRQSLVVIAAVLALLTFVPLEARADTPCFIGGQNVGIGNDVGWGDGVPLRTPQFWCTESGGCHGLWVRFDEAGFDGFTCQRL